MINSNIVNCTGLFLKIVYKYGKNMYLVDLSCISVSKPSSCKDKSIFNSVVFSDLNNIQTYLKDTLDLAEDSYYIISNGKKFDPSEEKPANGFTILHITPRIIGGKGGFGSMLRAIGAQIEKTTNREACRDLSGRRLRDINEEQRLKNWIAQQADREREAAERKKKKLERLCQEPKHDFKDNEYEESRSNMTEVMSSSIEQGFKASTSGTSQNLKRKSKGCTSKTDVKKKKKKLWIDAEESENSSDESNDSGNECEESVGDLKKNPAQSVGSSPKKTEDVAV